MEGDSGMGLVVEDKPSEAPDEECWRVGFVLAMVVIEEDLILNWYHIEQE